MKSVELKGRKSNIIIGEKSPIVVNCNVGVNDIHKLSYERIRLICYSVVKKLHRIP